MNNKELTESLKQTLQKYESKFPGNGLILIGTSNNGGEVEISLVSNYVDGDSMMALMINCIGQIPEEMLSPEFVDFMKHFELKKKL